MKGSRLIGTWKFVSLTATKPRGEVIHLYGEKLFGMLVYTTNGYMSVLLMDRGRPRFVSDDPFGGTTKEVMEAYRGFDSYCGTYTVDADKGIVVHHLQGSKFPNWVGSEQVRQFRVSDSTLTITADIQVKGENWYLEAVLERL